MNGTVADAIAERWRVLGSDQVSVTLDLDAEVYRLGYGDLSGFEKLYEVAREVGALVHRQPGIRLGVIVADQRVLVFSPVPALIAAGSRSPGGISAIVLDALPQAVADDLGLGTPGTQYVGLDAVEPADVEELRAELAEQPPLNFDVQDALRVFNSAIEFVELEVHGASLERRTEKLPPEILGIVGESARQRMKASYSLIGDDRALSGDEIRRLRDGLEKKYLRGIGKYGKAIVRTDKVAFQRDVEMLKKHLGEFAVRVHDGLEKQLDKLSEELETALLPIVSKAPPAEWFIAASGEARDGEIRTMLRSTIARAVRTPDYYTSEMRATVVVKAVTYESLQDPRFVDQAKAAFPDVAALHKEWRAATGTPVSPEMSDARRRDAQGYSVSMRIAMYTMASVHRTVIGDWSSGYCISQ